VSGIEFTFDFDASRLMRALDVALVEVSRHLRQNMSVSLRNVAVDARTNHRFISRKGNLERAIKYEVSSDGLEGRIYISETVAPYGGIVHDGTKKKNYPIQAKSARALHFVTHGNEVFVKKPFFVIHPGLRPDKFLTEAFNRQKSMIEARMRGAVKTALQIAGLK
jgi:hypothetical protein